MIDYVHEPDQHRYEIRDLGADDGGTDALAGFAEYRLPDDVHVDFVHTEVDDAYAGQGLASHVVAFALADVRAQGKRIIPHCPYVASWINKHPGEYDDITDWPV